MNGSKIRERQKAIMELIPERLWEIGRGRAVATVAAPLMWAIAALLLSGVETVYGLCPFGIAIICSAGGFMNSSAALCGAVLGTFGVGAYGVWQIAVCVGIYIYRLAVSAVIVKRGKRAFGAYSFRENVPLRLIGALTGAIGAGAVSVAYGASIYADIYSAAIGLALYPAFTYAFILVGSAGADQRKRLAGLCAVMYAVTLCACSWHFPFNIGAVVAFAATVAVSFRNGAVAGAAIGIFCGMAMEPAYAPLYPLAAFATGLVRQHSGSGAVTAASAVGVCWAVRVGGFEAMSDVLPELVFSAAILAPLANFRIFQGRELFCEMEEIRPPEDARGKEIEERMGRLSLSLSDLSGMLSEVSLRVQRPTADEAEGIIGYAVNKYCKDCVHREICSGCGARERKVFFKDLKERLCERGSASADVIPARLAARCHNADGILNYVNTAAGIKGRLAAESCKARLYASDYKAISALLRDVAKPSRDVWARDGEAEKRLRERLSEMGSEFAGISVYGKRMRKLYFRGMAMPNPAGENDLRKEGERIVGTRLSSPEFTIDGREVSAYMYSVPKFALEAGRYSASGKRDRESGDTAVSFENKEGFYYTLISDGMGSGREAALTSGISAVFLEKLLMAGSPMKTSLEMLNAFICGGDGECFTTVDLMEADLYTGKVSFIKSGAAPSFVLRGGKVFRLHSKTVPVGIIRALDAEVISFDIKEGDRIVMVSDGVTGSFEACPWLYEALESCEMYDLSPERAARRLGELAAKKTGKEDDITVAVIGVKGA